MQSKTINISIMAENKSVTAGQVMSATVKYSNRDDESRAYDIEADVNISSGRVNSIVSGSVRRFTEDGAMQQNIADFQRYDMLNLNANFYGISDEEKMEILSAVLGFMSEVVAAVSESANED